MTTTLNAGLRASWDATHAQWLIDVEEYEFMRSPFGGGRGHAEACKLIGTTADAFGDRARRWGYTYQP